MKFICLMFAVAMAPMTMAQTGSDAPYIAAQGRSETRVVPDLFPVSIQVTDVGTDAGASQALVEGLAGKVTDAARKLGVADADLTVGNLRIYPEHRWEREGEKQVFLGNRYERQIGVRLRKLSDLRALVSALPQGPNLRIQTQSFERSDSQAIKLRLQAEAVKDAQATAKNLADAVGVRLGRVQNVSDQPQSWNYARPMARQVDSVSVYGFNGSNVSTAEMVLKEGEITIGADAYIVYRIGD